MSQRTTTAISVQKKRDLAFYSAMSAFGRAVGASFSAPIRLYSWPGGEYKLSKAYKEHDLQVPKKVRDTREGVWLAGIMGTGILTFPVGTLVAVGTSHLGPPPIDVAASVLGIVATPVTLAALFNRAHATYQSGKLHAERYQLIDSRETRLFEVARKRPMPFVDSKDKEKLVLK